MKILILSGLKKIVKVFLKIIMTVFCPVDKRLITFIITTGTSGCNILPILEKVKDGKLSNYKIRVINTEPSTTMKQMIQNYLRKLNIMRSKVIVTTHGLSKLNSRAIHIELWHGFPAKKMALMDPRERRIEYKPDLICVHSSLDRIAMNACFGLTIDRYVITGAPRNDYLFTESGRRNLEKVFSTSLDTVKTVLFAPTFRVGYKNYIEGDRQIHARNIFGFKMFSYESFLSFLQNNNIILFVKLHPFEERILREQFKDLRTEAVRFIDSQLLKEAGMDLYKLLNGFDLLITDYSSIYFDWLLLDRPVIFVPVDYKEYCETRGGPLLEPFDFWAPGPKCTDQLNLENEILRCLSNESYYEKERKMIRDLVHQYKDGRSTDRVIELIEKIMQGDFFNRKREKTS